MVWIFHRWRDGRVVSFLQGRGGDGRTILRGNGGELVVYKRTIKTDFQYEGILRLLHS